MSGPENRFDLQSLQYWKNYSERIDSCFGVYPMGGGGEFEVYYRHYFELRNFLKHVSVSPESNLLELGCGVGRWALSLAPLVGKYVGIDVNSNAIRIAESIVNSEGIDNVKFFHQSITDFNPESYYDIIYFSGVSQYLSDQDLSFILNKIKPHLSNNAILVDRSTINIQKREILVNDSYVSIFRTPNEIAEIAYDNGWECYFKCRSYRFMRITPFLCKGKRQLFMLKILNLLGPNIFHLINGLSLILDTIKPVPFEGGYRSHDFMFFRNKL